MSATENELKVQVEEPVADPKHVEEMIAKAEGVDIPQAKEEEQQTPQEKLLAGKYKNPEELEKAYIELQKKLGQQPSKKPDEAKDSEEPKKPVEVPSIEQTKEVLEGMDLDFDSFYSEIQEKGSLSEESYKKFESHGIPKQMVELTIEGYRALADRATQTVYSIVGGEEPFKVVAQWAAINAPREAEKFNAAAASSNIEDLQMITEAIFSKYTKANGQAPNLIEGDTLASAVGDSYRSRAEWLEDVKNPKYDKDPAFRQGVIEKLSRSDGII